MRKVSGGENSFELEVIDQVPPKLHIPYTNWFHCDCLSSYYETEPLSEKHWALIEKYIKTAAAHGMNMILTPVFTPPLDTKVGFPSIRLKVFHEALQDLRALKLLEKIIGRTSVMEMFEEVRDFNRYPAEADYILKIREKVNERIKLNIHR